MSIDLDVVQLDDEQKSEYELIQKIEKGLAPLKEMPIRYYFENNHPNFPSLVVDYILDKHKLKNIGEFMETFYDEIDSLINIFPEYQDEGLRRSLDNEANEIMSEIFKTVNIGI